MPNTQYNSPLAAGLDNILNDIRSVCEQVPVDIYKTANNGAAIGGHMRHVLEFLQVLAGQATSGIIDYESRTRDIRYESDPEITARTCEEIIANLKKLLTNIDVNTPITVEETPGFGLEKLSIRSSLGREILFAVEHSVHHLAIIKMMAHEHGITFADGFGVASATQNYHANGPKNVSA